jgi:hypothetical protein
MEKFHARRILKLADYLHDKVASAPVRRVPLGRAALVRHGRLRGRLGRPRPRVPPRRAEDRRGTGETWDS